METEIYNFALLAIGNILEILEPWRETAKNIIQGKKEVTRQVEIVRIVEGNFMTQ